MNTELAYNEKLLLGEINTRLSSCDQVIDNLVLAIFLIIWGFVFVLEIRPRTWA